jgi:hypothetical protein
LAKTLGEERCQMRYRVVFIAGLGVGFVLGTRAGRERYEQMRTMARKVADSPAVQQAAAALQAQAAGYARSARGKIADRAGVARSKVGDALHERVPGMRSRDSNGDGRQHYSPVPGTPGGSPES